MQIQGHHVDKLKGRFSGTIDDVDEDAFKFDRMVVMLVVGRTAIGSVDVKDDGEVHAVMKIKVQDMQHLEGALRDQAIAYLAHGAGQGILDFGNYRHKGDESKKVEGQEALPVADYAAPADPPEGVDPATGEIDESSTARKSVKIINDPDEEFDVPPAAPEPVKPRLGDVDPPSTPTPARPQMDEAPPPAGTRVGTIRKGSRKDSDLEAFLNE